MNQKKEELLKLMKKRRWGDREIDDNKILDEFLEIIKAEKEAKVLAEV